MISSNNRKLDRNDRKHRRSYYRRKRRTDHLQLSLHSLQYPYRYNHDSVGTEGFSNTYKKYINSNVLTIFNDRFIDTENMTD